MPAPVNNRSLPEPAVLPHGGRYRQNILTKKNCFIQEKAKIATKSQEPNCIAYGANTHNGIIRNYNEDRISIVLDLKKPGFPQTK